MNTANLTISRQDQYSAGISLREKYQQSGKFGKYGEFDDISPKTKMQANALKARVPTMRRIRRMRKIGQYGEFDDILPKTEIYASELKRRVPIKRQGAPKPMFDCPGR